MYDRGFCLSVGVNERSLTSQRLVVMVVMEVTATTPRETFFLLCVSCPSNSFLMSNDVFDRFRW